MPTTVLCAWTFSASSQYCARTEEVAASRSGVLPGVRACGSVSLVQASAGLAADPARGGGERDQDRDGHEREQAEQAAAGVAAHARVGRVLRREEADREPGRAEQRDEQQQQRAELVAGVDAGGHRRAVDGQAVLGERPQHDRHGGQRGDASAATARSRSGTAMNQTARPIASAISAPRE